MAKSVDQIYYYSSRLKYRYGSIFVDTNEQFINSSSQENIIAKGKDFLNLEIIIDGIVCPKDHKYSEDMIIDPFSFKYHASNIIIYDHIYEKSLHNEAADKRRSSAICYLGFKVPPPPFPYKISFSSYPDNITKKELISLINDESLALSLPSRKKSEFDQDLHLRNYLLSKLQNHFSCIDSFTSMYSRYIYYLHANKD